ncbi:MAG: BolA family transcriptional regulator [Gammaproteobacteria bacterium]|nr:BolA family transcriptional regulator [Gammaproteobacteria bacterium]
MTTIDLINTALNTVFPDAAIDVQDDKADHIGHAHQDSGHFTVVIKSPVFEGKTPIQQHRMVYDALGSLMQTHIHALRIRTGN